MTEAERNQVDMARIAENLNRMGQVWQKWSEEVVPLIRKALRNFVRIWRKIERTLWDAYKRAGCPYGRRRSGMWKWLQELATIAQAAERAKRERCWREGLDRLRRHLAARTVTE